MGFKYNIPEYKILSDQELQVIHGTSLDILKNIGVKITNKEILERLDGAGACIDKKSQAVKLPGQLVLDSIERSGKKHILYGRDRNKKAEFGYDMFNFNGSSGQYQIVDQKTLKRRNPTVDDLKKAIAIGDSMDNINMVGAMVVPSDVPFEISDIIPFYHLLTLTDKPFTGWVFSGSSAKIIIEMMEIMAGGREELKSYPFYEVFIEPVSPLTFRDESLEILLEFAEKGLPVGFSPMVQVGATGPCSIAGTLALENAEILSGITIAQLINPGLPVSYGGIPHIFDMKAQMISFGSPEQAVMAAAMTQIGRHYGFPVYNNTGMSDSKCIDAQYGIEASSTLAYGTLARGDIFGHLGICGADNAANLTQLIIDNELAGSFIKILSGFDISEAEGAYKEIVREGAGGNFLGNEMTLKNFRKIIWYPDLFDRAPWDTWEKNGAKSTVFLAMEKEKELLKRYKPPLVSIEKLNEINRLLKPYNLDFK